MTKRTLNDFPVKEPVKSELDFESVRRKLAGLITSEHIHQMRERGLIEVIHLLLEEVAELKEEIAGLTQPDEHHK